MNRYMGPSDLPPGTSYRDLDRAVGADEPEDTWRPRCTQCSGLLKLKPEHRESLEDGEECDGIVRVEHRHYDAPEVAILGDEFSSRTYEVRSTTCDPGFERDVKPHAPHRVIYGVGEALYRHCLKCGAWNREVV